MGCGETWRDQDERRFQLVRAEAERAIEILDAHLPRISYHPGSATTLVTTTYLDTPESYLYELALAAEGARSLKLRLREYFPLSDDAERRVLATRLDCYLERKERTGQQRLKQRVALAKSEVGAIIERRSKLEGSGPEVRALRGELDSMSLEPVLVSAYERQVWGADDELRITFDERLRFHEPPLGLYDVADALTPEVLGAPIGAGPKRILELKHDSGRALPGWLAELVAPLTESGGYSKFLDGMQKRRDGEFFEPSLTRPVLASKA